MSTRTSRPTGRVEVGAACGPVVRWGLGVLSLASLSGCAGLIGLNAFSDGEPSGAGGGAATSSASGAAGHGGGGHGSGGHGGASAGSGGGSPTSSSKSATVSCGQTVCGTACVTLASDGANCGVCGHNCGHGASCSGGVCGAADVTPQPVNVHGGVAVDATGIYFSDGTTIRSCPVAGCTLAPTQVWNGTSATNLTAGGGTLAWVGTTDVGRTAIQQCTAASCSPTTIASGSAVDTVDSPVIVGQDLLYHKNTYGIPSYVADHILCSPITAAGCTGMTSYTGKPPFASDGQYLAYVPTTSGAPATFVACDLSATACTPTGLANTSGVLAIAAAQGTLFLAWAGNVGPNPTQLLQTCPLTGCTAGVKLVNTSSTDTVTSAIADASGVYWAYGGDHGSIWMCPAGGCAGGPRELASEQANAFSLQLSGGFVYWGAAGLTATPTQPGTFGLRRVAKPVIP